MNKERILLFSFRITETNLTMSHKACRTIRDRKNLLIPRCTLYTRLQNRTARQFAKIIHHLYERIKDMEDNEKQVRSGGRKEREREGGK